MASECELESVGIGWDFGFISTYVEEAFGSIRREGFTRLWDRARVRSYEDSDGTKLSTRSRWVSFMCTNASESGIRMTHVHEAITIAMPLAPAATRGTA